MLSCALLQYIGWGLHCHSKSQWLVAWQISLQVAICRFDPGLVDILYKKGARYKEEDIDCGIRAWAEATLIFIK